MAEKAKKRKENKNDDESKFERCAAVCCSGPRNLRFEFHYGKIEELLQMVFLFRSCFIAGGCGPVPLHKFAQGHPSGKNGQFIHTCKYI